MACWCKPGCRPNKAAASCLGRCDLPKHKCLDKEDVKPGPVPKNMGWLYTAKDSPEHQLRCGWRPGHISCQVLRKIEQHNCMKTGECAPCSSSCLRPPCSKPCCMPPKCVAACPSTTSCCKPAPPCGQPLIRIIRHGGQYTICTKPSNISNAPSGPYPLKYVLNTDTDDQSSTNVKYSVEAKFNDYHFDYTSSQSSFVLDFSPPEQRCYKPCPKKSFVCMVCSVENNWPGSKKKTVMKKHSKSKKKLKKPCPLECIEPCSQPCYKPCYSPCYKPCYTPCYKPCYTPCYKPCYTPCYKPCYTPCYKPCNKPCYKTCSKQCCKSSCKLSCKPCCKPSLKPCSTESLSCTVCSMESICPVKEKKKKKHKKNCKCQEEK